MGKRTDRGYVPKWNHVRLHAQSLAMAARQAADLANTPEGERDPEMLPFVRELVERSGTMLTIIAAALATERNPPKGKPKPAEVEAVTVPPLVPGGCVDLHRLAVDLAELATDAARLGTSRAAAFAPGAMAKLADRVKACGDRPA